MLQHTRPSTGVRAGRRLRNALTGILLGIALVYLVVYFSEIVRGAHRVDLELLGNLIWLGVGVLLFAFYETFVARQQ